MLGNKSICCVIPARLKSTRFPKKMLAPLKGKPLLQCTYERAKSCLFFDEVLIAVDSQELLDVVQGFGGKAILTSEKCESGTERLLEVHKSKIFHADIWINWQGDEPFISPSMIKTLLQSCESSKEEIWTLRSKMNRFDEKTSPHIVKVVCDHEGKALYFSRSYIPYEGENIYKHIGIYAFSNRALQKISTLKSCELEKTEKLEQLRFLYHGMHIQVHETNQKILGIDTKEELLLAEQMASVL